MLQASAYQPSIGMSMQDMQNVAERARPQNAIRINEGEVLAPSRLSAKIAASGEPQIAPWINERDPRIHFSKLRQCGVDRRLSAIDYDNELAKFRLFEHRTQRGPEYRPREIGNSDCRNGSCGSGSTRLQRPASIKRYTSINRHETPTITGNLALPSRRAEVNRWRGTWRSFYGCVT